jgi:hypothetical protein
MIYYIIQSGAYLPTLAVSYFLFLISLFILLSMVAQNIFFLSSDGVISFLSASYADLFLSLVHVFYKDSSQRLVGGAGVMGAAKNWQKLTCLNETETSVPA